jgi:hypothetical protein
MNISVPPLSSLAMLLHLFVMVMMLREFKKWPSHRMYKYLLDSPSRLKTLWRISNKSLATFQLAAILFDCTLLLLVGYDSMVSQFVTFFLSVELAICCLLSTMFLLLATSSKNRDPSITKLAKYFAFNEFLLAIAIGLAALTLLAWIR